MTPLVIGAATALAALAAAEAPGDGCVATVSELPAATQVDPGDARLEGRHLLVAHKSARRLMLFSRGSLQACWRIGLGFAPEGDKRVEGDGRTPVGWYPTSDKPWSTFDGAIAIHYPNAADAAEGLAAGTINRRQRDVIARASRRGEVPPQRTGMGGAVLIHGGGSASDWTLGCIALEDADLAQLRARLPRSKKTNLLVLE
jgi:murein L,D-transpeptidase YafK